jgi:hypothetical protein
MASACCCSFPREIESVFKAVAGEAVAVEAVEAIEVVEAAEAAEAAEAVGAVEAPRAFSPGPSALMPSKG